MNNLDNNSEQNIVTDKNQYVGFLTRFLAYIIDVIALSVIGFVVELVIDLFFPNNILLENNTLLKWQGIELNLNFIGTLIAWLYFGLMESSKWQATIGKKVIGIKVIDENNNRISFGRSTIRYFSRILSAFPVFIGYIMISFTSKKQSLHDIIAKTYVVKDTN